MSARAVLSTSHGEGLGVTVVVAKPSGTHCKGTSCDLFVMACLALALQLGKSRRHETVTVQQRADRAEGR